MGELVILYLKDVLFDKNNRKQLTGFFILSILLSCFYAYIDNK